MLSSCFKVPIFDPHSQWDELGYTVQAKYYELLANI